MLCSVELGLMSGEGSIKGKKRHTQFHKEFCNNNNNTLYYLTFSNTVISFLYFMLINIIIYIFTQLGAEAQK